ncbi:hypothetical protein F8388_002334 [Cannabis sativa]|uniref:Uncharacterized protein n=1 Tax=Cannabis sativa TaxID=3483 RepID=A0A7J6EHG1_CANSA|nr:hypothetical protein F8388_002334 [Cannabis sativa]
MQGPGGVGVSGAACLLLPSQPNNDLTDINDSSSSSSDPLLTKLEDDIHCIIVRRSAPDWLPFRRGSSYWVPPPRSRKCGLTQLVEKLANPLTEEESMSTTTVRGWPSSDYFIQGQEKITWVWVTAGLKEELAAHPIVADLCLHNK